MLFRSALELEYLTSSRAGMTTIAENYVGLPEGGLPGGGLSKGAVPHSGAQSGEGAAGLDQRCAGYR